MKRLSLVAATLLFSAWAGAAGPAANLERGKQVATNVCAACHAVDGNSGIATYPRLAGQNAFYIEHNAKLIRDGKRTTGNAKEMRDQMGAVSDQDLKDAALYFSKQYPKAGEVNPKNNPELGAKIFRGGIAERKVPACMSCHGPNGAGMPNEYPRISGQHAGYVETELKAYRDGVRKNAKMEKVAKMLTAEEMKAVANFIQGTY